MGIRYGVFFALGGIVIALTWMHSCSLMKDYPDDNFAEELIEDIILDKVGLSIDLSPNTPEKG